MSLSRIRIKKYIDENKFEDIKLHLEENYDDTTSLIPLDTFISAFNNFLNSGPETIANSYKIIELLHGHYNDPNRQQKYKLSPEHEKIAGLFNLYEKTLSNIPLTLEDKQAIEGIQGFRSTDFQKKIALLNERNNLREAYKEIDSIIKKDLIEPIKKGVAENKQKLPLNATFELNDIELRLQLADFIEKARKAIASDPKFKDKNNKFIFTDFELNQIIYERISFQVHRELKLEPSTIDKTLKEVIAPKDLPTLQQLAEYYKDKPGKEILYESTLKEIINLNNDVVDKELIEKLIQVQTKINDNLLKQHNQAIKPKNNFTAFEKRAIEIYERRNEDKLTNADRKILSNFFSYMQGNKEFSTRITRFSNNKNNEFAQIHADSLVKLSQFNLYTLNQNEIISLLDKIEIALDKKGEALKPAELESIKNFIKIENDIKFLRDNDINKGSKDIQRLIKTFDRAQRLDHFINSLGKEFPLELAPKKTLDHEIINNFIQKSNYEGLNNYLNKNFDDTNTLLNPKIFVDAFNKFIESDAKSLTNSYKVIELLHEHFFDENRHQKYKNSEAHKEVFGVFNVYEKIKSHQSLNTNDIERVEGIEGFSSAAYQKKFELHEERQNLRNVYKVADNFIEKNLVYGIKFPENTHFIRKLLNIPPKRNATDIEKEFTKKLPKFLESMRAEIKKDPTFKDKNGNFLLTEAELSQALYERLSLKATRQLGISQNGIDNALTNLNTQNLKSIIEEAYKVDIGNEIYPELAIKFQNLLIIQIPPHLVNFSNLKLDLFQMPNVYQTKFNDIFVKATENHFNTLKHQISYYKNKMGTDIILEQTLRALFARNLNLSIYEDKEYQEILLKPNELKEYETLLTQTQEKINSSLSQKHTLQPKPKNKFTPLEVRAIELYAKRNQIDYTPEDKKLLASFFNYAIGNKEFNRRLGNILKSNNDFVNHYKDDITTLYKFTHKTANLDKIVTSLDKLEFILLKMSKDPNYNFQDKEKITLSELGMILKFFDTKSLIEFFKHNDIYKNSNDIQNLINMHSRAGTLYTEFAHKIENQISNKDGDLVMAVASRLHDISRHSNLGFKWLIRDLITPYSHAAVGIQTGEKSGVAHVSKIYEQLTLNADFTLINKTFRVYPDKLLQDKNLSTHLEKALSGMEGQDLKEKMHNIYQEISRKLNDNASLKDPQNNLPFNQARHQARAEKAGLADLKPFGHRGDVKVRSWAEDVLKDKENIGQKIKDPNGRGYIICSEYAAKMTVLALVELEKQLITAIQKNDLKFKAPEKGLLKLPFHEYEDLGKVHPARLVKELSKVGAIEKIPESEIIKNTVKFR